MDFLPWKTFHRVVARYGGNHRVRTLPCSDHFRILAFAQLTYRESLRDIEACLTAQAGKLYHMGIRRPVKRATLADANERRDWRMYAEFGQKLIAQARPLYAGDEWAGELSNTVYALDSTTIDLCLSLYPWAPFRSAKAAVKMHTLLDLRGNIPEFIHVSDGKMHDVNVLDRMRPEPGAIYVMDRAYLDFGRLFTLHGWGAFFVTRAKSNTRLRRLYSAPHDRAQGIICDQTVVLEGPRSSRRYPHPLRRIRFKEPRTGKPLVFLTNLLGPSPTVICELYQARWQVELFFKWIKQHLRIKKFYGTSENAVKSQIWTAVSVYVLVAIIRKRLDLEVSLHTLLQIFSVTLFEKIVLNQDFLKPEYTCHRNRHANQLNLFDYLTGH